MLWLTVCGTLLQPVLPTYVPLKAASIVSLTHTATTTRSRDKWDLLVNVQFCDFVCWTPTGLYVERISFDLDFFQEMEQKLRQFFVSVIFPKVLCGNKENVHPSEKTGVYCYCRKGEVGAMVLCDSPDCKYAWMVPFFMCGSHISPNRCMVLS